MTTQFENVSPDLVWECVNGRGSQLRKTKMAGGHQFSADPYNLLNKHNRKQEGFVNPAAISIQRPHASSGKATSSLIFTTKKPNKAHQPAQSAHVTTYGANSSGRKLYKSIVSGTAKRGYRSDLRAEAVARASAIKLSQKEKKEEKVRKPRGAKARKAAEAE